MEDMETDPGIKTDFIVNTDGSINVDGIEIPPPPVPAWTVEGKNERLIITKLIARDFKSFAGTVEIGPFDKNFSCIVGPNGSGKSNVIDALLFVFGYRAQKIRSKKVSVLIHNSHKFPDLQSCSVTVNFATIKDEGQTYTIVPGSEFCVTRFGFKDNKSTYEINGTRAQYKDVASLLRNYGIDLDYNRFMILQGEIELISIMKPKGTEQDVGMLEYIEDIIGSDRFIKPIQHFNTKVEEINEVRIEKMKQLKIIEKERLDAEKPRNQALAYLRLANESVLLQNSVLQTEIYLATEEAENLNSEQEVLHEKIKEFSASLKELQDGKALKEEELKHIAREHKELSKVVEDFNQQFSKLEREDVACRENMKNNKDKIKKLTKTLETEESKLINIKKQPEVLKGEIVELEAKKEKLLDIIKKEEEKLSEVMGSVKEEIKEFQEEKDNLESKLVGLKSVVNEKQSELNLAQSELDLLLNPEKKEKETLEELQNEYTRIVSTIKEKETALTEAESRVSDLETKITSSKQQVLDFEARESSLADELKTKRVKLDESKNSLNASENRNALVKAFMEQKKQGNFTGVYGRLGDLGAIDAKYDVAISTACGPLDNIVVDSMTTAQECVQFLKANNLGYTTFIALDQMKRYEPQMKEKVSFPENVPRLFDLISVKNKDVLPAFYYALRDTLVTDELEQATRIGLRGSVRYRVVTSKGELVEASGAMTGGGTRAFKGRMGQSVASDNNISQKEVAKLAEDVENLSQELEGIRKRKFEMKEDIEKWVKELSSLQHSSKKSQQNRDSCLDQEKMLIDQIQEQKKKIVSAAPNKKKKSEMEAKIQEHEQNHAKASKDASVFENKVKELQDQIMAITKGKYGAAQKKLDKLTKEVEQISHNIAKNTAMLKNTDKNLKKAEAKVESISSELEACQNSVETLKEQSKDLESNGLEITKKKEEANDAMILCGVQKAAMTGEVNGLTTQITEIKSKVLELKNNVKNMEFELKGKQTHLEGLKRKLSKLELHDIEDGPTDLPVLPKEELEEVHTGNLHTKIGRIEAKMKEMQPDLGAIAEFKRKEEIYKSKLKDLEDTLAERDHYRGHYENLRRHRLQEFMRGFAIISLKVKQLYQMMTLGGDAELELVNSVDPFSEGIEFSVRPLRKTWKSIRMLSGGEKTLSSLSLVFALHYYRSNPFFVMDEIDAALDNRNVDIIGSYIRYHTKNAQFIVISLRERMFMLADHLVGIFKTNNRTKTVFVNRPPPPIEEAPSKDSSATNTAFDRLLNNQSLAKEPEPSVQTSEPEERITQDVPMATNGQTEPIPQENNSKSSDSDSYKSAEESLNRTNSSCNESAISKDSSKTAVGKGKGTKTPKKAARILDESKWSEDEDFVIATPSLSRKR